MSSTSAFESTTTLASTVTVSSTSPLQGNRPSSRPKTEEEYLALFGALQNQYGFSGTAPTRPAASRPKKRDEPPTSTSNATSSSSRSRPALTEQEQRFGILAASYGFNGAAPTLPTMPAPSGDAKRSLKFWKRTAA